jgi:hypothetical protein
LYRLVARIAQVWLTNHIASWLRIETIRDGNVSVRARRHSCFSYFILLFREEIENAAQQAGVIPAFTLALLQHLRRDIEPKRLDGRGSLVFQIAGAQDQGRSRRPG